MNEPLLLKYHVWCFLLRKSVPLTSNVISWCVDSKTSFLANCCLPFPVDDVQVSCYRILNSLYVLGTNKSIYVERYNMSGDTFYALHNTPTISQLLCIKPCPALQLLLCHSLLSHWPYHSPLQTATGTGKVFSCLLSSLSCRFPGTSDQQVQ